MIDVIKQLLNRFDFDKVHRAMLCVDWKWHYKEGPRTPTIAELVTTAQGLLEDVVNKPDVISMETGGFKAWRSEEEDGQTILRLSFQLEAVGTDLPQSNLLNEPSS